MSEPVAAPLWDPLRLSLQTAGVALLFMVPVGVWLAWCLARARPGFFRVFCETVVLLPLVLPPILVGYGLLLLLGRGTRAGQFLNDTLHLQWLFTWQGASLAAFVMGLPLLVRASQAAIEAVDGDLLDAGRSAGANETQLLWHVLLPLARRGIAVGITLAFARALGEFGATLMVAGNIAGQTQTLPLHLYEAIQTGRDTDALRDALILGACAWILSALASWWTRRR